MRILFIDILTGLRSKRRKISRSVFDGDAYSEILRKEMSVRPGQWRRLDLSKENLPQDPSRFDAVVIGGSTISQIAGREKRWMKKIYPFVREAVRAGVPVLGICGGLQSVARALGARIIANPKGEELDTARLALSPEGARDPLFRGIPKKFRVGTVHRDMIKELKPGWRLLASSPECRIQAVAIGENVRLVQFHPEFSAEHLRRIAGSPEKLIRKGLIEKPADFGPFLDSIDHNRAAGRRILRNFVKYFVKHR